MNENIDLTKILKDCPKGIKLYSTVHGEVEFQQIRIGSAYPININLKSDISENLTSDGKLIDDYDGECILFPSKTQRDWDKFIAPWIKKERFDPKTLQPFDKVLARDAEHTMWRASFFSHQNEGAYREYITTEYSYVCCIPYNDDTKHLVGTKDEAPEYYRYWEE